MNTQHLGKIVYLLKCGGFHASLQRTDIGSTGGQAEIFLAQTLGFANGFESFSKVVVRLRGIGHTLRLISNDLYRATIYSVHLYTAMFITRDTYKSPVAAFFLGNGEAGWSATELALQQTWFLVQLEEFEAGGDPEFSCNRTLLLFDFQSVERFILSGQDRNLRLKSVHIVTPGHINGSDSWQMNQLRAVWQGREPVDGYEIPMDIFETVCGKKYPASFSSLSNEELATGILKFEFSQ